jgi:hypothetical protein
MLTVGGLISQMLAHHQMIKTFAE